MALLASTIVFGIAAQPASAALGINGTVGAPTSTVFGKAVTFTGTINNTGTGAAEAFTAVTFADAGSVGLSTIVPVPVTAVAAGGSAPFTVTAVVSGAPGTSAQLKLTATGVTASAADVDPTGPIVGTAFTVTDAVVFTVATERQQGGVYTPCLPASCTVSIDDGLRYTVTVQNVSDVPATDVKIMAPAPANTTTVAATTTIPPSPITLAPGPPQSYVQEVTVNDPTNDVDPPQPGSVLTFNASATYDTVLPAVLNDRPAGGSPATFLATVVDPRLTITNALADNNGGQLVRGDPVLSTIMIDNTGNADATNTVVTATLTNLTNPIDVKIDGSNAPASRVDVTGSTVTVRIGSGANSSSGGTITPADTPIVVTFISTVVNSPTGSPARAMSTASVSFDNGGVSPKTATAQLDILPQPSISLLITPTPASPGPVARGGLISYQIAATNGTGVAAATNLEISFPIPAQTTFQSATSAGGSAPTGGPGGPITSTFANVAAGATVSMTVVVKVNAGATQTAGPANDIMANASATFGPGINPTVPAPAVGHELSVAELDISTSLSDANGGQLLPGEVVASSTTVTNTGTANATGTVLTVTLTDNLQNPDATSVRINGLVPPDPAQVTTSATSVTVRIGAGANGTVGGTLTPGQTVAVSFNAVVIAAPPTPAQAKTSASVAFGNGGVSPKTATAQLDIKQRPNVTVAISPTPGTPVPRDSDVSYLITVSNAAGVADATNVTVSFPIPANTTFVSAMAPGGSVPAGFPAGPVTTTFATIPAGTSATFTVVVHVAANPTKTPGTAPPNDIVATANVSYGPGGPFTASASVGLEVTAADLKLEISPNSTSIQKAKPADIVVKVSNLGPDPATGAKTVTITADGGGTITSAVGCTTVTASQVTCTTPGPIASGGNVSFPIQVVKATPGPVTVTASLAPPTAVEIDENPANNVPVSASITFTQSSSDLSITGSGPVALVFGTPTQNITYTLHVNDATPPNTGDPAEGVQVSIPIPAQVQATAATFTGAAAGTCSVPAGSGGTVTCSIGNIVDGGSVAITLTLQGTALLPVAVPVEATATATNDDPSTPNKVSVLVSVVPQPVDLSVNDRPANTVIPTTGPNTTVGTQTFPVTVTNNSPTYTAGSYTLTVAPNPLVATTVVALTSATAGCSAAGNVVTCTGTNLAPGATATFNVKVDINDPGPFPLRSTVTLGGPTQADPVSNNVDDWGVELATADLTLAISTPTPTIQKAKPAIVNVTVGNLGAEAATGTKTVTINLTGVSSGTIQSAPAGCTINAAGTQAVCVITAAIPAGGNVVLALQVISPNPGTATLTASLSATGLESDENTANNVNVSASVQFLQSSSDLSIASGGPATLVFGAPTKNITYTVSVNDPNPPPNNGDPAEGVVVTIPILAGLQATAASFSGTVSGSCVVPGGSGGTVTCTIGNVPHLGVVTVTVTLQGTGLIPTATDVTATATSTNDDPTTPNTASDAVIVLPQPIDLSVNNVADAVIQTPNPSAATGTRNFTVTVTNNAPLLPVPYTTGPYTLTVSSPSPATDLALSAPGCTPPSGNVITCTDTSGLAPGASKDFVVTVTLSVPGPITITSSVALGASTQLDANPANNTDTWIVTRNRPPAVLADLGPTIPAGATTLVYDVLSNDTDADLDNLTISSATAPAAAGVTVTVDAGKKVRVVATSGTPLGTFDVTYVVNDGHESTTQTATLKVKVVDAIAREAQGSFGHAQPAAKTFGHDIAPARISDTATQVDVLNVLDTAAALGKQADGTDYPTGLSYNVVNVNPGSLNVTGSVVSLQAVTAGTPTTPPSAPRNVISYTPAKGYTSDPGQHPANDPPADDFTYTTKGLKGAAEVFSVDAGVRVEVKNQNPIGVDSTFDVPNGVTQVGKPAGNDIDGNTVKDPITTQRPAQSFVFDDEGILDPVRLLKIRCIGPVPALDPTTNLPATLADAVCPDSGPYSDGWKKPGEDLVLETPDSHGKVTAKLAADLQNVSMAADATAVGNLDFAYVIVDDHGGAGFGLATARVPNTPPQVIEGVRTVIKNTPTLVVDTKLATQDANGDTIKVSSAPDTTEQGGKVVIGDSSRTITYTPKKDYLGPDKLLYNVSDGRADGAASAILQLNVIEQPTDLTAAGTGGAGTGAAAGGAAAGSPAGSLAKTGGDPLPLTAAAGCSLVLGLALVQAGRRRGSRPLLDQARHLRT